MNLDQLISCCLTTDPKIVSGDYTVIFSNSKSGALRSGVLMFTDSDLPQRLAHNVEYRLVSILTMLFDIETYVADNPTELNFQVSLPMDFRETSKDCETKLLEALQNRGVKSALAHELVKGEQRLF